MFGIFARSFMTATRSRGLDDGPTRHDLPKLSWLEADLPFKAHGSGRSGYDD